MSDKSLGILAGSLFSILFVFTLIYFGPQTITYVRMRPLLLRTPDAPPRGWGSAPEPLEELEVPTARRFVISRDGYQFEVPRGELKSERGDGMIASRQDTEFVSASLRLTPLIRQLFIVALQTLRSFSERLFTNRSTNNLGK